MQTIRRTTQFKRDVRRLRRRGKDLDKLKRVISLLLSNGPLPERLRDHELSGRWRGVRDLHIEPDWIFLESEAAARSEAVSCFRDFAARNSPCTLIAEILIYMIWGAPMVLRHFQSKGVAFLAFGLFGLSTTLDL